ncbi:hypothetical protein [Halomonas faecis]|uniref:hypothetical protein n=1 Tax=Halomonas faecis TaxID=1562110 RepID=UPI0013D8A2CA|nr:hypothetical protein [Halomonas faecis]
MTPSSDVSLPVRRRKSATPVWRRWWPTLLVVVLLLSLLEAGHRWLESRSEAPLYRVIVAGESLTLDAETHADFSCDVAAFVDDSRGRLAARMTPWVERRLEAAYAPLEAAVPGYLNWYFSPSGSYARLGVALLGDLDDWLDGQLHARLIEPSGIESALAKLQVDYPLRLARERRRLVDELAATLQARYAPLQVDAAADDGKPPALDLDETLQRSLRDSRDRVRWNLAAAGGGGVGLLAGRALAVRLGSTAAGQGSRLAVRGLASRLGAGAARALLGGGSVAAVSAPSGPGALVAGTVTTVATLAGIAGSEFAMLKAQEALQRPAMQAQLHDEIARGRAAMSLTLKAATVSRPLLDEAETMPTAYRIVDRLSEPER